MATRKANIHDNVIEDNSRAVDINHHIEVENKYMSMAQRYITTNDGKSCYGFCLIR